MADIKQIKVGEDIYNIKDETARNELSDKKVNNIKVNNNFVQIDEQGNALLEIPTKTSDITNDSNYQTAQQVQQAIEENLVPNATATVDNNTGTPSVEVTKNGNNIDFAFSGLKGAKGDPMTFDDLTPAQKEELKGDQGDSAVYDPSSPDTPDFVMANTTGNSTTKAMTQKAVTEALEEIATFEDERIDVTKYAFKNGVYIAANNNWWRTGVGGNGCRFIPVNPGEKYKIVAKEGSSYSHCVFLTTNNYSNKGEVSYAGGITTYSSWPNGEIRVVPEDAAYLYIKVTASNVDITPTVYRIKSVKERVTELNSYEDTKNTLDAFLDDSVVDDFELTGRNNESSHTLTEVYAVPTIIGRMYQIKLSATTWSCTNVSSSANALWVHHTPDGTEASQAGRVVDKKTGNQIFFSRPSAIWSDTFVFIALNNYVVFNFRGDEGETLGITVSNYPEREDLTDDIENRLAFLEEDEIIGTQNYVGQCSGGNSTKSGGCFPVIPGKTYQMDFSTVEWDCSGVKSTANAVLVSNASASSLGDNVQVSWVVDILTNTRMSNRRPSNMPGRTIMFVPTTSWIQVIIRATTGEEIDVTLTRLSKISTSNVQIGTLANTIEDLKNGIGISQDIVAVNGGLTELDSKFQALRWRRNQGQSSAGNRPCVLLHFSDLHGYSTHLNRILEFGETFSSYIDDILHTGDTVNDQFGDKNYLGDLEDTYVLNVIGNHDNWDSSNKEGDSVNERVLPTKVYTKFIKPFADYQDGNLQGSGITQPDNAESLGLCYYYKDYYDSKLRLIVLDCMAWDNAQADWFAGVLADAQTNGFTVLCADHYCPHSSWTSIRECSFTSVVLGISTFLNAEAAGILQNAIDNGLVFVCWLFGHHHRDQFGYLADYPTQFALAVDKAGNNSSHERDSVRISTGRSYDCFNVLAIDTTCKIMTVMRIGNNRDKFMRQKNYLVFDFANGKILHNS